jgi:hypothetical protein
LRDRFFAHLSISEAHHWTTDGLQKFGALQFIFRLRFDGVMHAVELRLA